MPLTWKGNEITYWTVNKIAVVGPGIVGMPMAAMLAHARIREGGTEPAKVVVVQRNSPTSGWKVDAINAGKSPIGGVEPALDTIVAESVAEGLLSASYDYAELADADMILICTQTDKKGFAPEYGPLFEALNGIAAALQKKPAGNVPIVVFESTLAPSSMVTVMRPLREVRARRRQGHPARQLAQPRDAGPPGRACRARRQARGRAAPAHARAHRAHLRAHRHRRHVYRTNSLTAEVVKTLENAYRDVRIAYAAEVARYCDAHDIDFFALRDKVNAKVARGDDASADPHAVPSGALLVPTVGVGGHCLPKDGILLWWRAIEAKEDISKSLILESRHINDESPAATLALAERRFGSLEGKRVALLGVAYRFDSEDTRNSPTLVLAQALLDHGADPVLHDPYVHERDQNLAKTKMTSRFTTDLDAALKNADVIFLCTAHGFYQEHRAQIANAPAAGIVDACNLFDPHTLDGMRDRYTGIGRGHKAPSDALVDVAVKGFRAVEMGVANELSTLIDYLNERYATDDFNRATLNEVRRLAATCTTGCDIAQPGVVAALPVVDGFSSRLAATGRA